MCAQGVCWHICILRTRHVCVCICLSSRHVRWYVLLVRKVYDDVAWIRYRYRILSCSCTITHVAPWRCQVSCTCLIITILKLHSALYQSKVSANHPVTILTQRYSLLCEDMTCWDLGGREYSGSWSIKRRFFSGIFWHGIFANGDCTTVRCTCGFHVLQWDIL